jgi:hypothetical protein
MAAKTAFLLASRQLRVSEDWVVETVDIELAAHHAVIETGLLLPRHRGFRFCLLRFGLLAPAPLRRFEDEP